MTIRMIILLVAFTAVSASAQSYSVDWYVIGSGGGNSHSATYSIDGTVGQTVVGKSFTQTYIIESGYWVGVSGPAGCEYTPGDANGNGIYNGMDVSYSVNYLKGMGEPPPDTCGCRSHGMIYAAADVNGNCVFNGMDVSYSVNFLKGMGPGAEACPDCPPQGGLTPPAPALEPKIGIAKKEAMR